MLTVIVPVKGGYAAKSRLAPELHPADRTALSHEMADHVLSLAQALPDLHRLVVVTACPEMHRIAQRNGAEIVRDRLNAGTAAACHQAIGRAGFDRILFLNADLPLLTIDALQRMLATDDALVIATDRSATGTNALLRPAGIAILPAFGPDSRRRHEVAAAQTGVPVRLFTDAATAFDIDLPDDLRTLGRWRGRTWWKGSDLAWVA